MQSRTYATTILAMALTLSFTHSTFGQTTTSGQESPTADPIRVHSGAEEMVPFAPSRFLQGMKRVFTTGENLYILAIGSGSTAFISPFDQDISDNLEEDDLDEIEVKIPNKLGGFAIATGGPLVVHLLSRALNKPTIANTSLYMFEAVVTTQFVTFLIKKSVSRTRPDESNNLSFPSGHSSAMFALASVVGKRHGLKAAIPGYALAAFVGVTRVKSKKHFPADVIAGATVGTIIGRSFVPSKAGAGTFGILPMFDGATAGVTWYLQF